MTADTLSPRFAPNGEESFPNPPPPFPCLVFRVDYNRQADAITGAAINVHMGKVADAGSWSPEVGGMNRWLAKYYEQVLKKSRPLIVYVHVSVREIRHGGQGLSSSHVRHTHVALN